MKKTIKNCAGEYVYNGTMHALDGHGFVIDCKDTEHYREKEEVDDGTWYFDRLGSGAHICWFVPNE